MIKLLLSSIVFTALLAASPASGQAAPVPSAPREQLQLEVDGVQGMWFSMDRARLILADVQAYRELDTSLVPKLELRVKLADLEITYLRGALVSSEKAEKTATSALTAAIRRAREAEEDRDSLWSGQPAVWAVIGALAVGVTVALVH